MDLEKLYINGDWAEPAGGGLIDVINPATETHIASGPQETAADIDRAVRAAAAAFPRWSTTAAADRRRYLLAIADELRARAPAVADTIVAELGMPIDATLAVQVLGAAEILENYADEIGTLTWEHKPGTRWWSRNQSASRALSRRGTTRCTRSRPKPARRSRPDARS